MQSSYGDSKGERVFYASINKGNPGTKKWEGKRAAAPVSRPLRKR